MEYFAHPPMVAPDYGTLVPMDREEIVPTTIRIPERIHRPARMKAADMRISLQRIIVALLAHWAGAPEPPAIPAPEQLATSLSVPLSEHFSKTVEFDTVHEYTVRYADRESCDAGELLRVILSTDDQEIRSATMSALRAIVRGLGQEGPGDLPGVQAGATRRRARKKSEN